MSDTIRELLSHGADDATALIAPDGATLNYRDLRAIVESLSGELSAYGVGPHDRVAMSVNNGPTAAITFLASANRAAAAPLNPKYRESEFEFYLTDLKPKVLIVAADSGDAVLAAAKTVGVPVATVAGSMGELTLGRAAKSVNDWPADDDTGLLLHTSGTTSRPKVVPISQRNLARSAANIATSLALTDADRSLNVMPLFHIHGLLAGLLAPLSVGATVVATPGFDAFAFFAQLATFSPTYYTAVPTMHQMIIDRGQKRGPEAAAAKLRFIRSSSASLPSSVLEQLEELFHAPVVEAYGMTEATHQMCANPLPPGQRKPRSVGVPTGIELAVLDDAAEPVPSGSTGQVAIKGQTIVSRYEDNETATKEAFRNGWFLTGDQGYLDEDGYLFLTGRLKELINRGGEKISPLEVDEALLRHESVAQAVTFGVAHGKLGEDVAAGVVLRPEMTATERELKDFLSRSLAAFKVPRTIVFLEELPKGATGKLQRIGLAERLGVGPW